MEIGKLFKKYKLPEQFIYAGADYLYLIKKEKKTYTRIGNYYDYSVNIPNQDTGTTEPDMASNPILDTLRTQLDSKPTGILLNSSFFIMNILRFEKMPFNKKKLDDIVHWRIEKIFPEKLDQYIHHYYKLNTDNILSILIPKETKDRIDNLFFRLGVKQRYMGCSTIEIINSLYRSQSPLVFPGSGRQLPDFFVEIWGNAATLVYQNRRTPLYIRKFNFNDIKDLNSEISKTLNYIISTFTLTPALYSVFMNHNEMDPGQIKPDLEAADPVQFPVSDINSLVDGVSQ